MSIITKSDFKTDIKIANKSDAAVNEDLTNFITEREPEFLGMLFGSDFATLFYNGIVPPVTDPVTPQDPRMVALLTPRLRKAIATYIWYYYQRDQFEQVVGLGTVKTNPQNALLSSPRDKMLKTWFDMMKTCWQVQKFLKDDDGEIYPEWVVPNWFNIFCQSWVTWSWGWDIFDSSFFYGFYGFYRIPDIFYPLSRL